MQQDFQERKCKTQPQKLRHSVFIISPHQYRTEWLHILLKPFSSSRRARYFWLPIRSLFALHHFI